MTPTEFFKSHQQYKLWIGTLDEYSAGKNNYKGYFKTIGVEEKWSYIFPEEYKPNVWVCILYVGSYSSGSDYEVHGDRWIPTRKNNNSGWTYWYTFSKYKPSPDDVLHELISFLDNFSESNDLDGFIEHLERRKIEFAEDLNKIDLSHEQTKLKYASYLRMHIEELILNEKWYGSSGADGKTNWSKSAGGMEKFITNYFRLVEY